MEKHQRRNSILATPADRFLAALIDLIPILLARIPYIGPAFGILSVFYFIFRDSIPKLNGQSVGKRIIRIKVIDEITNKSINKQHSISVLRNISLIIPFFNILDAIMVFSDERKRYGDRWAKTLVIKDK